LSGIPDSGKVWPGLRVVGLGTPSPATQKRCRGIGAREVFVSRLAGSAYDENRATQACAPIPEQRPTDAILAGA